MSVTIHLRPEVERRLAERAAEAGLTLEDFLQQLAEREGANGSPRPVPTFEEMTTPIAEAVRVTGMTDDEVAQFFEEVVEEVRAERRAKREPPA